MLHNAPVVIVMPVYEDRESAKLLLRELADVLPAPPYVVAVEDGSVREPLRIGDITGAGLTGEVLYLMRNMGHQRAIAVGVSYVAAHLETESLIVMDSDGEDTPQSIPALLERLRRGDVDAVFARRRKRTETLKFRAFYTVYKLIFKLLTGRTIAFGNFSALGPIAIRRIAAMQEAWVHYAASLLVSKLRIGEVPTDRGRRYAGKPHMNFTSLSLHGLRSIMVFAEDVLVRVGLFSVIFAVAATGMLGAAVVLKIIGYATPGWFSTAVGLLLLMVLQAGVLTFVTLMVSGFVKSGPPLTKAQLDQLIARVEKSGRVPTAGEFAPTGIP
jgi:glycosyltransferase involved in cell wall biosynthesis